MVKIKRSNFEESRYRPYDTHDRRSYRYFDRLHNTAKAHRSQNSFVEGHFARSQRNSNDKYENHSLYELQRENATTTLPFHRTHNNATSHRHLDEEEWREDVCADKIGKRQEHRESKRKRRSSSLSSLPHKHHSRKHKYSPSSLSNSLQGSLEREDKELDFRQAEKLENKSHKRSRFSHEPELYDHEYNEQRPKYFRSERREPMEQELLPPPPPYSEHILHRNKTHFCDKCSDEYRRGSYRENDHYYYDNYKQHAKRGVYAENDNCYRYKDDNYNNRERIGYEKGDNANEHYLPTEKVTSERHARNRHSHNNTRSKEHKHERYELYDRHKQELNDKSRKSYDRKLGYSHNRRFGYGQMYISRSATPSSTSSRDSRASSFVSRDLWNRESESHEYYDQDNWKGFSSTKYKGYHGNNNNKQISDHEHRYFDQMNMDKDRDNIKEYSNQIRHKTNKEGSTLHETINKFNSNSAGVKNELLQNEKPTWTRATDVLPILSPISPISSESTSVPPTPGHSSVHSEKEFNFATKANTKEDIQLEKLSETVEERGKEQQQQLHQEEQKKATESHCEEKKGLDDSRNVPALAVNANTDVKNQYKGDHNRTNKCVEAKKKDNNSDSISKGDSGSSCKLIVQARKRREEIEKEYYTWLYSATSKSGSTEETRTFKPEVESQNKEESFAKKESDEEYEKKEMHSPQTTLQASLRTVASTNWRSIKPTEPFYAETDLTALQRAPQLSPFSSFYFTQSINEQEQTEEWKHSIGAEHELHAVKSEEVQSNTLHDSIDVDEKDKCKLIHSDLYNKEAIACFNHHFNYGKVHPKPPWYLCANLHDNCEHPYYVDWLDTIDLPELSEQLSLARVKRTVLASANKQTKDEGNS